MLPPQTFRSCPNGRSYYSIWNCIDGKELSSCFSDKEKIFMFLAIPFTNWSIYILLRCYLNAQRLDNLSSFSEVSHSGSPLSPPPFVNGWEGGGLDFLTQPNLGETEIFRNQRGKKNRGNWEFLKFSLGEKLLEMKLQTENTFQNKFQKNFMSYTINYLSNSSFS